MTGEDAVNWKEVIELRLQSQMRPALHCSAGCKDNKQSDKTCRVWQCVIQAPLRECRHAVMLHSVLHVVPRYQQCMWVWVDPIVGVTRVQHSGEFSWSRSLPNDVLQVKYKSVSLLMSAAPCTVVQLRATCCWKVTKAKLVTVTW